MISLTNVFITPRGNPKFKGTPERNTYSLLNKWTPPKKESVIGSLEALEGAGSVECLHVSETRKCLQGWKLGGLLSSLDIAASPRAANSIGKSSAFSKMCIQGCPGGSVR